MLLVLWKKWFSPERDPDLATEVGDSPEMRVKAIQAGDESFREPFIIQYRPFIAKTASRFSRRFIDPNRDDEFSVALAAFDEAINRWSADAGSRFLGFAETVITRRLIDYARQEGRHASTIPYSAFTDDDGEGDGYLSRLESAAAIEVFEENEMAERRRSEIALLTEELVPFGIRFQDLADGSPQHRDSRRVLLRMGSRIARTPEWFRMLQDKRQLPVKELCKAEAVSRKTVERHRKYLIAVSLIAIGPYPCLQQYIHLEPRGEEDRA